MARIDHTGHNHPATPAARAACRKAMAAGAAPVMNPVPPVDYVTSHIRAQVAAYKIKARMDRDYDAAEEARYDAGILDGEHCSQCGSTDMEDIATGQDPDYQGYSRCCNEPVVSGGCDRCTH